VKEKEKGVSDDNDDKRTMCLLSKTMSSRWWLEEEGELGWTVSRARENGL
jgi:hypothetical protein